MMIEPRAGSRFTDRSGTIWEVKEVVRDLMDRNFYMVRLVLAGDERPFPPGHEIPSTEWTDWLADNVG